MHKGRVPTPQALRPLSSRGNKSNANDKLDEINVNVTVINN